MSAARPPAAAFAARTKVPADRTVEEIRALLSSRGASRIVVDYNGAVRTVIFVRKDRPYRLSVPIPDVMDKAFAYDGRGLLRPLAKRAVVHDAEVRRRWRVLLLFVKATLAAIDGGLLTFEQAFMPAVVLGNGLTAGEHFAAQLDVGQLPTIPQKLLAGPGPST